MSLAGKRRCASNASAEYVQSVGSRSCRDNQRRLLISHAFWYTHQGIDRVYRVFRESAVGGKAIGAVALVPVTVVHAVIEASGVHALPAAFAATTAGVDFDRDPVANLEFVHTGPQFGHDPHVFIARRKILVERRSAWDERRPATTDHFEIGPANRRCLDPHQYLGHIRLGNPI